MYSICLDGKVLDFKYKRYAQHGYTFYVGDIYLGMVFNMGRYWSAVSNIPNNLCPVDGFKDRFHASEFLINISGLLKSDSEKNAVIKYSEELKCASKAFNDLMKSKNAE